MQIWNLYHDVIKLIKNQFWINFLNNVEEKKVFQTYKFTKSHLIKKLFLIQNLQKELKTEFNEKCKTFLKAMYSSSLKIQINEELLLNESIQWSRVIEEKIKHAINFSAFRKAFESNDMSFAIIQRAYKSILKIFNLVYSDLIENDYHSKIWREDTKIILKKLNKSNYSILKTYKIITLLNCLNKVAEKIIAVQLSYIAEINNKLLNFDQMRDRKQRSVIDVILNLVHDVQMMKIDWSRQVKSSRSSRVLDSSRLDSSQNSWFKYSSQVEMFNLSNWVELKSWNWVSTQNSRLDSSKHEDR